MACDHRSSRSCDWSLVELSWCCYSLPGLTVAWQQLVTMEEDDWGFLCFKNVDMMSASPWKHRTFRHWGSKSECVGKRRREKIYPIIHPVVFYYHYYRWGFTASYFSYTKRTNRSPRRERTRLIRLTLHSVSTFYDTVTFLYHLRKESPLPMIWTR